MIKLGEDVMILDLHRQGLSGRRQITGQISLDRKTVRTYIAKGLDPPAYKKRPPRRAHRSLRTLCVERLAAYPALTARRLLRN